MNRNGHYSGIGGQAVIEGVMMRNEDIYAVAVRTEDGKIEVQSGEYLGLLHGSALLKTPFVRGIFVFINSLVLGMRCLNISVDYIDVEGETASSGKTDGKTDGREKEGVSDAAFKLLTYVFAFAIAIGVFIVIPYYLAAFLMTFIRNAALLSLLEGVLRIAIFIGYILLISRMEDVKRLFGYHGAEHKCINCIESGKTLNLQNVRESTRLHKRCGSSFILFVMLVSIVLFFFIRVEAVPVRILLRILLMPVIAGISYELIRLAGSSDNIFVRILSAPGFWLQGLTTREPDDEMIEVGIKSVEAVFDWRAYQRSVFGRVLEEGV